MQKQLLSNYQMALKLECISISAELSENTFDTKTNEICANNSTHEDKG